MAAFFFSLAALTDWLDGYLARRLNQSTPFGAFLDPVADKLIVVTALVIIVAHHNSPWLTLPGIIIVCREIMISALREWMAEMRNSIAVAVNQLGKVKTAVQMTAIILLLALPPSPDSTLVLIAYTLIYVAATMTLWSMLAYLKAAWPTLTKGLSRSS